MKIMKKYFKVVLCFMAFALCSFMFAFAPTLTATYALDLTADKYNVAINAIKMPQEEVDYNNKDAKFRVPLLDTVLGNKVGDGNEDDADILNYTIRVVDPSGYPHNYVMNGTNSDKFFGDVEEFEGRDHLIVNAKNDGEYKVIYIVTNGSREYYSNSYKVTVKNVSYELDFSTPVVDANKKIIGYTKNLIKSKLAVSSTPYELPVAYAKVTGEELKVKADGSVDHEAATIKVTKDGAPQEVDAQGSIFTSDEGKFYITPSEAGVYTVEYIFENSANRPTKTYTINVEEGFVAEELKLASTPTIPTIELGKKDIELPRLTINAGSNKNVDVNIKSIVIEKETDSNIKCVLSNNDLTFDMTIDSFGVTSYNDLVGNYRITYTVEDAYGKTKTETFKVDGVTVSSKPQIYFAYNKDADAKPVLGAETELKAEYEVEEGISLPAVYVEDAVATKSSDFIIIRTIRKGSTYYYVDNKKYDEDTKTLVDVTSEDKGYNAAPVGSYGDTSKAAIFKFNTNAQNIEGTYYVEYKVISKAVKERENNLYVTGTNEKYTFKVVASHTETTPEITITNLQDKFVKNTDEITVKVSSTDTLDTRLKNAVFTYTGTTGATTLEADIETAIDAVQGAAGYNKTCHIFEDEDFITAMQTKYTNFAIVKEVEDAKNSFELDLKGKSGTVYVAAATINDDGKVDTDVKELTLKNTSEITPPTISIVDGKSFVDSGSIVEEKYGQGVKVYLPKVYAVDFNEGKTGIDDKTLSLNVMYYVLPEDNNGEQEPISYKSPTGKVFSYGKYEINSVERDVQFVDGGVITTSETGVYYVVYTATDVAGNTSVMYFSFTVEDTSKPILSVEAVGDNITRTGNTVEGSKGTVIDFEATLRSSDGKSDYSDNVVISIEDDGRGLDYQPSGNSKTSYVFNDYGTYVVTISGKNDKGIDADSKVIKVNIVKQEIKWLGEFDIPQYAAKKKEVKLPDIAASNDAVVTVSVTAPGGSAPIAGDAEKITDDNGFTYWVFTTNEDSKGTYTVTYTATNDEDVLTKTFSIKVGDNVAPKFSSLNKGELTQDLIYDGENDIEYVVEVNKSKKTFVVKAISNGKEVYSHNLELKISDKDDTGSTNSNMSWTNLSYELTGPKVSKGETTSNSTQYLISGTGKYALTLTIKDSYDNVRTETIEFNVVTESKVEESKDTVVGAVLIVISLVLLAGVILFFMLTGKKGGKTTKTTKARKEKAEKKVEEKADVVETAEKKEEVEEVVEEKVEEANTEEISETEKATEIEETTETKVDDEPKSGDVE